ncbi:hypothetical protein BH24BAC1_BH24BAC1_30930 [soil metagenome]
MVNSTQLGAIDGQVLTTRSDHTSVGVNTSAKYTLFRAATSSIALA